MIQTQWPGIGQTYAQQAAGGLVPRNSGLLAPPATLGDDAIEAGWWNETPPSITTPSSTGNSPWTGGPGAILQQIMALLGQLVGGLFGGIPPSGAQQRFSDVDVSSTGDPHLAATGTRETANGTQTVDQHFDSMNSHDDLVDSYGIVGGYRVSTNVTQPAANGVTWNRSATVHTNFEQDAITMNRDGSFAISDAGQAVSLTKGQNVTLSGGETVTENQDGSLVVAASNGTGGSISTTLRATGNGVDVTTHAHEIAAGGDVLNHGRHRR